VGVDCFGALLIEGVFFWGGGWGALCMIAISVSSRMYRNRGSGELVNEVDVGSEMCYQWVFGLW